MPDAACNNGKGKGVEAKCNSDIPNSQATLDSKNSTIGYILGFEEGWALVYLREEKKYVEMDIQSGDYRPYPYVRSKVIYFSALNCTGTAIAEQFKGEVGKAVLYIQDSRYFLVNSLDDYSSSNFIYKSQFSWTGGCTDTGELSFDRIAGTMTETSRPYDFASIAPFTVKYKYVMLNKTLKRRSILVRGRPKAGSFR